MALEESLLGAPRTRESGPLTTLRSMAATFQKSTLKHVLTSLHFKREKDPNLDDLLSPTAALLYKRNEQSGIVQTDFSFTDDFEFVNGIPAFVLKAQDQQNEGDANFTCFAFSKSGSHLVTGDDKGRIRIWDARGLKEVNTRTNAGSTEIGCVGFLHSSEDIIVSCDVLGSIECFSFEDDVYLQGTNEALDAILEHCFIHDDSLAVQVAQDPTLTSSQIWPPRISADGSTIAQGVCIRSDPGSFLSKVLIFITRVTRSSLNSTTLQSDRRSLLSHVKPSPNGGGLIVAFAPPLPQQREALGSSIRPPEVEVWPEISLLTARVGSLVLPCEVAIWAKDGDWIIGWKSGNQVEDDEAMVFVWEKSSLLAPVSTPVPLVSHRMEKDDTIFHVELLTPQKGRSEDDILLAVCFAESNEASLIVNIWDASLDAVITQFDTSTLYQKTLVGLRQFLNRSEVMSYHWGHTKWVMEQSLTKMCVSSNKKWIAFYSSESNRGYLWSMRAGVPIAQLDLPPHLSDEALNEVSAMKGISFAPDDTKIVLMGAQRIIALVPSFLQTQRGYQMRFINSPLDKCTLFEALKLSYNGSTLAIGGQIKDNNVTTIAAKFGPCIVNIMEGEASSQAPLGTDLKDSTKAAKDIALSLDGALVGFLFNDNQVAIASTNTAVLDPILNLCRFPNEQVLQTVSIATEDIYNRLFFSHLSNGEEQLVCFSLQHKGCIVWFHVYSYAFIDRIPLSVDRALGVKLSKARSQAVVLSTQMAQIIDLESRQVIQEIGYAVSIPRARHLLFTRSSDEAQIVSKDSDQYEVSEDGTLVLIGWDIARNCALYLTPHTKYNDFAKYSQQVTGGLNSNVKLSSSSRWVFVSTEKQVEEGNEGEKGICVFDTKGMIPPRQMPDDLDQTGCRPLFEVSEDGRIIVARSVFQRETNESTLSDSIIVLTPYAIEGSIPDFHRLHLTKKTENPETISKLIEEFGWPLLNSIDSQEKSIFQHALTSGKHSWLVELCELSKAQGIPVNLFWKEAEGDGEIQVYRNSLKWALQYSSETRSDEAVRYQLDCLVKHLTTVSATAHIFKSEMNDLYTYFPDQFIHIFEANQLVAELGNAPVALEIMEQSKDPFIVGSDSNVLSWELQGPEKVTKLWQSMDISLPAEVKNGRKRAEIQAESKFVLIEDVASIGMKGLLRRLLMMDVPVKLFESDIVQWTVAHKWNTYGYQRCRQEVLEYILLLVIFTIYAMLLSHCGPTFDGKEGYLLFIPLILAMYMGGRNLRQEYVQIRRFRDDAEKEFKNPQLGVRYYFKSQWNWMELFSYFVLMCPIPVFHFIATVSDEGNTTLTALVSVQSIIMWWKLLYFAQAIKMSGYLVVMIREIIRDILVFLFLFGMILAGFSIAFFVLFRHDEEQENFGTFWVSLSTMFVTILGDFDLSDYRDAKYLRLLAVLLFVSYTFIMVIVLLNLLIAIMSDSYDRVKSQDVAEFIKCRAMVIDDSEATMSDEEIKRYEKQIGRYLHVLTPVARPDVKDEWQGKIGAMARSVNSRIDDYKVTMTKQLNGIEESIKQLKQQLESGDIQG